MVGELQRMAACGVRAVHRLFPFIRFVLFVCVVFVPAVAHVSGEPVATSVAAVNASVNDTGPAIWFADHYRAHRVSVATHLIDHVIPLAHEATALAIDPRDRSLWVLSHKRLQKFDAQTSLVHDIDLNQLAPRTNGRRGKQRKNNHQKIEDPKGLVLNAHDGSVWIRGERTIIHASDAGRYLSWWSSEEKIESFALSRDESLFVLTRKRLVHLSPAAVELASYWLGLREDGAYRHIAVDALGGVVWLADEEALYQRSLASLGERAALRVYPVAREDQSRRERGDDGRDDGRDDGYRHGYIEALALDPLSGNVWLAHNRALYVLSRDGVLIDTVDLAAQGIHRVEALAFDATSRHLFVGGKRTIAQLGLDAHAVAQIPVDRELEALGVSPLALAPRLRLTQPGEGTLTNNARIPLRFEWGADCNEAPCEAGQVYIDGFTLEVMLNDQPIGAEFVRLANEAVYAPTERYPEGMNTFTAQVRDAFGHSSVPILGHFVVDTTPPVFVRLAPSDGSTLATAEATLEGGLDDAAAAIGLENLTTIGGMLVRDDPLDFAFKVPLKPGPNAFTLIATDTAGNQTRKTINVTRTAGVSVRVDNVMDGATVATDRILVMGAYDGPPNTGITVNGQVAQTYGQRFFANNVTLRSGDNTLTIIATTSAGATHEQTLTMISTAPAAFSVERAAPAAAAVRTIAGTGVNGFGGDGGPATEAALSWPDGVAVGPDGSVYIADSDNHRVRRVLPDGRIVTVAGNGQAGFSGDGGPATQARLSRPYGIAVGPDGSVYIADTGNSRVRKVGVDGFISTFAGGSSAGGVYNFGDYGPAVQAWLRSPVAVTLGPDASVYITDTNRVRKVAPDGIITTVAGTGEGGSGGDGGPATQAQLYLPDETAVGADGSLYIADSGNNRIRRVTPDGIITTVAGTGEYGYAGDGGAATDAQLAWPAAIALAPDGSLYITETDNSCIRRVSADGIVTTVAGTGTAGYAGDGGHPTAAQFAWPYGAALGPDGTLYVADTMNQRIRAFTTLDTSGTTAPLLVGFRLDSQTAAPIQRIEADYDGDGTVDFSTTDEALQHHYTQSGAYVARFTVTDATGAIHTLDYAVVLPDVARTDTMLRAVYTDMLAALKAQDIDTALQAVTGGAYEKYQSIFTTLHAELPQTVDRLGELQGGVIAEEMAEYVLVREVGGDKRAFLLYFLRGEDGVWRIDGM